MADAPPHRPAQSAKARDDTIANEPTSLLNTPTCDNVAMVMPRPSDKAEQLLLQTVWDLFFTKGKWPTFDEVDRRLYRAHEIDSHDVMRALPKELLYPPAQILPPQENEELRLTVAGAASCAGSNEDLLLFVDVVRLAAELEHGWMGPPVEEDRTPTLTSSIVNDHVRLPAAGREALLERVGRLLLVEPWGWTGGSVLGGAGGWLFTFDRRVRRFSGVRDLPDYWERRSSDGGEISPLASVEEDPMAETVFLVHGRDKAAKFEVARVLQRLTNNQPVILDEQASRGRTLVEKFEEHATTSAFAVVLLTPDDFGGAIDEESSPRARQNVVFELGFFFGSLGRAKVVVLNQGVEKPSDVDGIVYIPYPDANWQLKLGQEMRAAGLDVDLNRLD